MVYDNISPLTGPGGVQVILIVVSVCDIVVKLSLHGTKIIKGGHHVLCKEKCLRVSLTGRITITWTYKMWWRQYSISSTINSSNLKKTFLKITRVCSCNIFNRRAKQLVKVICTLTYWTKPKILQWLWQCGSCIHTDRRLYNAYHKHLESHAPTIHLAPL